MALVNTAAQPLKSVRDMPQFPAAIGAANDHAYLERCRAMGPFLRDRFHTITSFSMAHLNHFFDDRWTRQMEMEVMHASGVKGGASYELVQNALLFSNGQTHRDRRSPLARTFAQPLMVALRPAVADRVQRMIEPLVGAGSIPFIEKLSGPLPACTVASVIGAPEVDGPLFSELAYVAARGIGICPAAQRVEADAAVGTVTDYVRKLIESRREAPQDDFLTSYVDKVKDGPLNETEIRAQIVGLVVAGSDTTRGSLTSIFSQLLQHPEQWALVVEDPDRYAAGAVQEGLRYDPIIGALARIVTEEIEIEGYAIPPRSVITPSVMAALRDPEVYADPGTFDITRTDHPRLHPVFGFGVHRCIGETLARIQLEEAIKTLARLAPNARIDGAPTRLRGFSAIRTATEMQVVLA